VMAAELLLVADRRRPGAPLKNQRETIHLRQFVRVDKEMRELSRPVPVDERPPARSVPGT